MEEQKIIELCGKYGIIPNNIEILRKERVLAKVNSDQKYFLKGEIADKAHWENCCHYSRLLLESGLNVTQYLKSLDATYIVEFEDKVFSLEINLAGKPVEVLTDREITEIGRLLGIQHALSIKIPTPFNTATSWSLFGGNLTDEIGNYDENELSFLDFKKHYEDQPLFSNIESLYQEYRKSIYEIWGLLPQGAVQGDFCYYNMLLEEDGSLAIYDFNLAGNEVYLNECIAVGVYHAWHAPYEGKLKEEERFQLFIDSYTRERPFNVIEQATFLQLKAIIRAFRYDRIEEGISLKVENEQNLFLQNTLFILENAR
ncbi:hypothetical protein MKX96_11230 [Psychrobacillus sp. FSL W7-1493]|uniref:phosphotransferase enzyme family protein n=1 Tax=Psychrobacillus sp. FSL W7-1493 TaxID=2921552 RepID=UPI0030FAA9A4